MKPRSLLTLISTSGVAGVALIHLQLTAVEREAAGGNKVPLLIALDDIPAGTPLTKDQLAVRQVPEAYVSSRTVSATDTNQVLGIRVSTELKANDFLQWTDLSQGQTTGRDLSSLIQNGMRALSLKGDNLFDGLLRPGDSVDVLLTTHEHESSTFALLQNVMVLSVGGVVDPADSKTNVRGSPAVVLSVTLEQSQLLTQALGHGNVTLVLRNPNDIVIAKNTPSAAVRDVILLSQPSKAQPAAANVAASKPVELQHVR